MRRRHTRATDPNLAGGTVQRAYRIPEVQIAAVKEAIATGLPDIHNVTDAVTDALWLWLYENSKATNPASVAERAVAVGLIPPAQVPVAESSEAPEPTEADHPYTGHQERPKWADVDLAVLDGDS